MFVGERWELLACTNHLYRWEHAVEGLHRTCLHYVARKARLSCSLSLEQWVLDQFAHELKHQYPVAALGVVQSTESHPRACKWLCWGTSRTHLSRPREKPRSLDSQQLNPRFTYIDPPNHPQCSNYSIPGVPWSVWEPHSRRGCLGLPPDPVRCPHRYLADERPGWKEQ